MEWWWNQGFIMDCEIDLSTCGEICDMVNVWGDEVYGWGRGLELG